MHIVTQILAVLVAIEFFYICYLETFATTSKTTARVFNLSQEELATPALNTLFKNQGVYNGLVGVLVLVAVLVASKLWLGLLLAYIVLVAIYGGVTSDKAIILKQGGIAILALLSLFL